MHNLNDSEENNHRSNQKLQNKLFRYRIIVATGIIVLILYSYFQFIESRKNLLFEVSNTESVLNDMQQKLRSVKSEHGPNPSFTSNIEDLNNNTARMKRHFHFFESWGMDHHPFQSGLRVSINDFAAVLKTRYRQGLWNERDEQAQSQMNSYLEDYSLMLQNERFLLNHSYENPLKTLFDAFDTEELLNIQQNIDHLAYTYGHLQKFPDKVSVIPEKDVKKRVKDLFDVPQGEVTIRYNPSKEMTQTSGHYLFQINDEGIAYSGSINAYNGTLQEFSGHNALEEGELIPEKQSRSKLRSFLQRAYGDKFDYNVDYKGINYRYSSNTNRKNYTYHVTPKIEDHVVNATFRIRVGARSGKLGSMRMIDRQTFKPYISLAEPNVNVTYQEGMEEAKNQYPNQKVTYENTLYPPSILTNRYELVHVYQIDSHDEFYLNVDTGEQDIPY